MSSGFDNSVSSLSEVSVSLGLSGGDKAFGVLGEVLSEGLGSLSSKISWGIFFVFVLGLGSVSSLLVKDGKNLGDSFSNNSNTSQLDLRSRGNLGGSEADKFRSEFVQVLDEGGFVLLSKFVGFNFLLVVLHFKRVLK